MVYYLRHELWKKPFTIGVALLIVALAALAAPRGSAIAGPPEPAIEPITFGLFDGSLAQLKVLKTDWYRVTAKWGEIEATKGVYSFAALDAMVIPATKKGMKVIIAMHSNAPWGTVCQTQDYFSAPRPGDVPAFKKFVRNVAERYDDDGISDAPGLAAPVNHFQVENQWVTAVFFRDSSNCPAPGLAHAEEILGIALGDGPPENRGNPNKAANEFVREYNAVHAGIRAANANSLLGPGNIPTQTMDAALFCQGKLGEFFVQNVLKADGSVALTLSWRKTQVCNKAGVNERNIKTWVRYWNVVLEKVMPRIKSRTDYIDLAHYGRYQDVQLRNEWAFERAEAWGFADAPELVAWELAGPDRRVTTPGANPQREVALELPKRIALAFATGTSAVTWFHNHFNPAAAVGVRFTSLLDAAGKRTQTYWNYRLMVNRISGAESAELERIGADKLGAGGAYLVHFAFPNGDRVTVAWADEGLQVAVPVSKASVGVIVAAGKQNPVLKNTTAPGKILTIDLTSVPVLIID